MNHSWEDRYNLSSEPSEERLVSLDAYRGLIMIALAFNGFGLAETAKRFLESDPESTFWKNVRFQFSHVEWQGCSFWDLIQPSFMFMVGVSMAYSYVKRMERGDSWWRMFFHAATRALILCLLGIFLISNGQSSTDWSLMNVLTQIGLGYLFLFLAWKLPWPIQVLCIIALLAGTWGMYHFHKVEPIDLEKGAPEIGVTAEWAAEHLEGVPAAWQKNNNIGHAIDLKLLNLLPQKKPFEFNRGGYQTINFIPSLATMLIGLLCGQLLRSAQFPFRKFAFLCILGILCIGAGLLWESQGCPLVKRLWTPSWALFSTGICVVILALLYGVIDLLGWKWWSFPLVVVGMNSIAIYVMGMLLRSWTSKSITTHFGSQAFDFLGPNYQPMVQATLVGLCFWLACFYMYRNKIFVRI